MTSLSLWNWLKPLQRQSKVCWRHPRRRQRTIRERIAPRLEALEDRTVPSTLTVTSTADSGTGSLRAEIAAANSGDTINFAPSLAGQTITLTSGELDINTSLDIEGLGANQLTISGNNQSGVFNTASNALVTIAGLTISNGLGAGGGISNDGMLAINNCTITGNRAVGTPGSNYTYSGVAIPGGNGIGGGIWAYSGTLSINSCTIADNEAIGGSGVGLNAAGDGYGGGLYISGGTVTINNSTVAGNQAIAGNSYEGFGEGIGGGIENAGGTLTINNSTISGNQATGGNCYLSSSYGFGGGISNAAAGTISINNSTIADNQAVGVNGGAYGLLNNGVGYGGGIDILDGGGIDFSGGGVSINNSTVAGNQEVSDRSGNHSISDIFTGLGGGIYGSPQMYDTILADNTADVGPDLYGSVTSLGHNLIGNTTGGNGFAASDLVNANPQLGPLQNNGGPTQTMALLPGSPAINAGDSTNAPAYDQRGPGYPRIVGGFIDIGAFEVQNSSATQASSLAVTGFPSIVTAGSAGSFTVTAKNADGTTDTSYTGTVRFSSSDVQAGLPAVYTFTAADSGVHPFSATLKTAGTQSITVTDISFGTTGTETGLNVTATTASRLAFGQQPSTTTAGQTISPAVTVEVEDPYGNVVPTDNSTVTLTLSSGTFANGSARVSATASGGVATFGTLTIDTAGSYTLIATDGSLTAAGSTSFSVNPAAASTLSVSGFPSPTTAGVAQNFTVTLKDRYGNIASGYTGTVHFTSSDAQAGLPANYTFTAADAGVHTFSATLKTAGTQSITAADTTTSSLTGTDGGITVNAAAASKFIITAPSSVQPGVPFSLTVTVEDAYGNVIVGYTGTIHVSSTDRKATLPANYTFTASDAGVHTFTGLVLHRTGNQKITITDTHNSSLTDSAIVDVL